MKPLVKRVAAAAATVAVAFAGGALAGLHAAHAESVRLVLPSAPVQLAPPASAPLPDFARIVAENSPAVVHISVRAPAREGENDAVPIDVPDGSPLGDLLRRFGGAARGSGTPPPLREGLGSGFVLTPDGIVLTNAHVVADATDIVVKLADRREFRGRVLGVDRHSDVAVVKIDARALPTVRLGDANALQVGQWVLAIGAPFGFDRTATQGIVSALKRSLPGETYVPFIQTDVPINPGNSGGPLFDTAGRVVGINSQIYTRSGGYMGLSFAIPIDVAVGVAVQLAERGRVERGWLGVITQDLDQDLAQSFGMERARGALVSSVGAESPARAAGLKPGDVVVAFGDTRIENNGDLPPLIARTAPGQRVTMTVLRHGAEKKLDVQIARLPDEGGLKKASDEKPRARAGINITVAELDARARKALDVPSGGVLVRQVGHGTAAAAGVMPGDVLLSVGERPITGVDSLKAIVAALPADKPVPLLIKRGGMELFLALRPGGTGKPV
ncbi:MAG: Do family serine endopeptidase [Burkholderiaceae bacterium]